MPQQTRPISPTYVEDRDHFITEVINNAQIEWRDDRQAISGVVELTTVLLTTEPDQDFLDGLRGFLVYCSLNTNVRRGEALATICHDLAQFRDHRDKDWFSPRTARYGKYLTGASGARPPFVSREEGGKLRRQNKGGRRGDTLV